MFFSGVATGKSCVCSGKSPLPMLMQGQEASRGMVVKVHLDVCEIFKMSCGGCYLYNNRTTRVGILYNI